MVAKFRRSAAAENDLLSIWRYIASDNPEAATRVLHGSDEKCALLGGNPKLGPARPDLAPEMRYFTVGNYLILYREVPDGVEIVRVVHGARDLTDIFPARE